MWLARATMLDTDQVVELASDEYNEWVGLLQNEVNRLREMSNHVKLDRTAIEYRAIAEVLDMRLRNAAEKRDQFAVGAPKRMYLVFPEVGSAFCLDDDGDIMVAPVNIDNTVDWENLTELDSRADEHDEILCGVIQPLLLGLHRASVYISATR